MYNAALQERRDAYRTCRKSVTCIDQQNQLPEIKLVRPELKGVYSQVLTDVLRRLDKGFESFFRRVKKGEKPGFPRFRATSRYRSFTYPQSGFAIKEGKLRLSKIGHVKIKLHRVIEGTVKGVTISQSSTGKWFACFLVEASSSQFQSTVQIVGIDMGLKNFATLSTGEVFENPRFFREEANKLAKAQRRLSKTRRGSWEHKRKRKVVVRVHERIVNRRKDFAHKLSRYIVSKFGIIVFEKLDIRRMLKHPNLAVSIADAAWSQVIQFVSYKAEYAGGQILKVNPAGTSSTTHCCSVRVEITIADRELHCPNCNSVVDRDFNAALNILSLGLQTFGVAKEAVL